MTNDGKIVTVKLLQILGVVEKLEKLKLEDQYRYFFLLTVVTGLLLALFLFVVIGRMVLNHMRMWNRRSQSQSKESSVDPWAEAARRMQVEGDKQADPDDGDAEPKA